MSCRRCSPAGLCPACAALLARAAGTPAAAMTHTQLQNRVREVCRRLGYLHFHVHRSRTKEEEGWPDSAIVAPAEHPLAGTLFLAELKTVGEVPTLPQRRWLEALGGVTRVESGLVWPEDLEDFVARLQRRMP
jgi:hypothetical protein